MSKASFLASARFDTPNCCFTLSASKFLTLEVFNALLACWLAFFIAVFVAVVASFFAELKRIFKIPKYGPTYDLPLVQLVPFVKHVYTMKDIFVPSN